MKLGPASTTGHFGPVGRLPRLLCIAVKHSFDILISGFVAVGARSDPAFLSLLLLPRERGSLGRSDRLRDRKEVRFSILGDTDGATVEGANRGRAGSQVAAMQPWSGSEE